MGCEAQLAAQFMIRSVHAGLQVSTYSGVRFVILWLTHRQTYRQRAFDQLYY